MDDYFLSQKAWDKMLDTTDISDWASSAWRVRNGGLGNEFFIVERSSEKAVRISRLFFERVVATAMSEGLIPEHEPLCAGQEDHPLLDSSVSGFLLQLAYFSAHE